jgi:ABC-2 type transport system permease protein
MRLIAGMQYRAAAWAGVATQFFWGTIELLVYSAFYRAARDAPMAFNQLADFIWLRQAFLAMFALWAQDEELLNMVVKGDAAYELCRPCTIYTFWYARLLATRFARTLLRCFPILMVAAFLPEPFRFHLPPGVGAAVLFVPALLMAALLVAAVSMFIYLLTFVTLSSAGTKLLFGVTGEFLMGALIPIPFMPEALQRVLDFLPFRYLADFPFRVYSGHIPVAGALTGIGIQAVWIVLLIGTGLLAFRGIQKRIVVQGG